MFLIRTLICHEFLDSLRDYIYLLKGNNHPHFLPERKLYRLNTQLPPLRVSYFGGNIQKQYWTFGAERILQGDA